MLYVVVYEGDYNIVVVVSVYIDNFLKEMELLLILDDVLFFLVKIVSGMFVDLNKKGYDSIKQLCEEYVKRIVILIDLYKCFESDDVEMVVEFVLYYGRDVNIMVNGNRIFLLWVSL